MIEINPTIKPSDLESKIREFWKISGKKILDIEKNYDAAKGSPVFTDRGKYTTRGWTEWTQGFQYGSAILQYDATGDSEFLEIGRQNTDVWLVRKMCQCLGRIVGCNDDLDKLPVDNGLCSDAVHLAVQCDYSAKAGHGICFVSSFVGLEQ